MAWVKLFMFCCVDSTYDPEESRTGHLEGKVDILMVSLMCQLARLLSPVIQSVAVKVIW